VQPKWCLSPLQVSAYLSARRVWWHARFDCGFDDLTRALVLCFKEACGLWMSLELMFLSVMSYSCICVCALCPGLMLCLTSSGD